MNGDMPFTPDGKAGEEGPGLDLRSSTGAGGGEDEDEDEDVPGEGGAKGPEIGPVCGLDG